jgi:hypothetical protein
VEKVTKEQEKYIAALKEDPSIPNDSERRISLVEWSSSMYLCLTRRQMSSLQAKQIGCGLAFMKDIRMPFADLLL